MFLDELFYFVTQFVQLSIELISSEDSKMLVGQSPYHLYLKPMEEEKETINHYMGETIDKYPTLIF